MKRRNGFTLVELLAVIVILAIIALIAVPIVMNVIEDARKGAAKSSALGYLDATEKQMARSLLDSDKSNDITDGVYEISDLDAKNVKVKGDKPSEGWVQISGGKITSYSFKIGKYIINPKENNISETEVSKGETVKAKPAGGSSSTPSVKTYTVGEAISYNPETGAKCNSPVSTTGTKTGCMKFYVIKDNGSSVDALLNHNTTAMVAYETSGTYKEYAQASIKTTVDSDTSSWTNVTNPRLITANEIATITGNTSWNSSTARSGQYFYFGSNDTTDYSSQTEEQKAKQRSFAWLFDYTNECTNYGCNTADSSTIGYWTSSPVSNDSSSAWFVTDGHLYDLSVDNDIFGVRPVVTIQKSKLQ